MKNNKKTEDINFLIKDVLKVNVLTFAEIFSKYDLSQFQDLIEDARRFADDTLSPLFKENEEEIQFKLGHIQMPAQHKKAWDCIRNSDWLSILGSTPTTGKYIPESIKLPLMELFMSADLSLGFNMMQTAEAAQILDRFKSAPSIEKLYKPIFSGAWTAAIAGRNLQFLATPDQIKLTAKAESKYFTFSGEEKFLMGGDQDLGENILYILPAKVQTDKKGAEKVGLFAIPKLRVDDPTQHNNIVIQQYHSTAGLKNFPMCDVSFGEIGETQGHLLTLLEPESDITQELISVQQRYATMIASHILEVAHHLMLDVADEDTQLAEAEEIKKLIDSPSNMESFLTINALQKGVKGAVYQMMFFKDCAKHGASVQQENFENLVNFYQSILKSYITASGSRILNTLLAVTGETGATNILPLETFLKDLIACGNMGGNNIALNHQVASQLLIKNEGAIFKSFIEDLQDIDPQNVKTDPLKQAIMEWQDYLGGAFLLQDELLKDEDGSLGPIYANRINYFFGALIISGSLIRQGIAAENILVEMGANMLHLKQESKRDETVKDLYERILIADFFASQILSQEENIIRTIQKKSAGAIADFFS